MKFPVFFALSLALSAGPAAAADPVQDLFRKLNGGSNLDPNSILYGKMSTKWAAGDRKGAAEIATRTGLFYSLTLRQFASRLESLGTEPITPLDDFQASVIGLIRDRKDFRTVVTGDFRYQGNVAGIEQPFPFRNTHYDLLSSRGENLYGVLTRFEPQWEANRVQPGPRAGVLTSRGFGERYYLGGTNRRAVEAAFKMFLCAPLTEWKDARVSDERVRRDVDRIPGGNPATYQTECRACHGPMDSLAGAFAKWDFSNQTLTFVGAANLAPKYNQNVGTYPEGFVTVDDSYLNPLVETADSAFKWGAKTTGFGVKDFGEMISTSGRFGECMSQQVFELVCKKSGKSVPNEVKLWASRLAKTNYDMQDLFAEVAASDACR